MLIAKDKLKNNIVEYILYMWRIEDLLRAMNFDMEAIKSNLINIQSDDEQTLKEIEQWYVDLINQMKLQQIEKSGHLNELDEKIRELNFLHFMLSSTMPDENYIKQLELIQPLLEEFRVKSQMDKQTDVEVCLHALNMKLLLKLQKKEVSAATENAFKEFSKLLAMLSKRYKNQFDLVN
jgi:hypothetical protein